MKTLTYLLLATSVAILSSCDKKPAEEESKTGTMSQITLDLVESDTPLLPVKKGDYWKYQVMVDIPANVTSAEASPVETEYEKVRTYRGKFSPGEDMSEVDVFDVRIPGEALERELVIITEKLILLRGTDQPEITDSKAVWLDPPVPFVVAGMRAGIKMPDLSIQDGKQNRGLKVVGREQVKVPAGEFTAIRLLMTGNDGIFEIRKTTWFVPQVGIVKEEKAQYATGKRLYRETSVLTETSVKLE